MVPEIGDLLECFAIQDTEGSVLGNDTGFSPCFKELLVLGGSKLKGCSRYPSVCVDKCTGRASLPSTSRGYRLHYIVGVFV